MNLKNWIRQNSKDHRRECKFIVSPHCPTEMLTRATSSFYEAYPPRVINSIYFDTPDYQLYRDSIDGQSERFKARIRWYGEGKKTYPATFEFKFRSGSSVSKVRIFLGEFDPKHFESTLKFNGLVRAHNMPEPIRWIVDSCAPVLRTVYQRKYFMAAPDVRVTIDHDLRTSRFIGGQEISNGLSRFTEEYPLIEVKHPIDLNVDISGVMNLRACRLSRYSKYTNGMDAFLTGLNLSGI